MLIRGKGKSPQESKRSEISNLKCYNICAFAKNVKLFKCEKLAESMGHTHLSKINSVIPRGKTTTNKLTKGLLIVHTMRDKTIYDKLIASLSILIL